MRVAGLVLLALLCSPATASAESIVYVRGGQVWSMAPDGTGARQVTNGPLTYEWPSQADDGTIVDADPIGVLHRITPAGAEISQLPTAAVGATDDNPAETPTHVRISPDGTKIAYDEAIDGDVTTLWTPADATTLNFPNQTYGQEGFIAPSWIASDRLLVSRDPSADDGTALNLYTVGNADDTTTEWFDDPTSDWASGFDAAAARSGARTAILQDDAADADGKPTRLVLRIFDGTTPRCGIELPLSDDYDSSSPTFSPDGQHLAWAEDDGIHVSDADCHEHVITLPGAWEPFWSAAALPAAPANAIANAKLTLGLSSRAHPHKRTVAKRGITARITVSAPTTIRLTLRGSGRSVTTTRKLTDAGTVKIRLHPRRTAKRYTLKLTAPGADAATATVSPR